MTGHRKWDSLRSKFTEKQKRDSDRKLSQLKVDMVLSELRKHSGMTQKELAEVLGVSQPTLSSQEHQDDMEIGTLSRMVAAMGGRLELIVHMPKGDIRLTQFEGVTVPDPIE